MRPMTCIVGIAHKNRVYLGADTQGTAGGRITRGPDKLVTVGPVIVGFCGSYRSPQILQHKVTLPDPGVDLVRWLSVDFVDAWRAARKESGDETKYTDGSESCGAGLLIGLQGRLFWLERDYSVFEMPEHAIGSGGTAARGSLHTSAQLWTQPRRRLTAALDAACSLNSGCSAPYTFLSA